MPRKQNTQSENFNKPFPKALRELMDANGTTQSELAASLQKTRQVISCYCDGSTSPTWETIAGIANFYHVSADWLLGLSDVRSTDTHIREICEYTGLSEEVISILHDEKQLEDEENQNNENDEPFYSYALFNLNHLIVAEDFGVLMLEMGKAIDRRQNMASYKELKEYLSDEAMANVIKWKQETGGEVLSGSSAADRHAERAGVLFTMLVRAISRSVSEDE